jgi:hypothetical protein
MSVLLRNPASVPALFSKTIEPDRWADAALARERSQRRIFLLQRPGFVQGLAGAALSLVMLMAAAPLLKAAAPPL